MNKNAKEVIREIGAVAALSFCAGFGVVLCLITTYAIPCNAVTLGIGSAAISLLCSAAFVVGGRGFLFLLPPDMYL